MPTYEYRCNACKGEFEYQQKMSDPDLVTCEVCRENKLEKLISWTSVRSNNWQQGLYSANPREAMTGLNAVDRGRPPKQEPTPTPPPMPDDAAATTTATSPTPDATADTTIDDAPPATDGDQADRGQRARDESRDDADAT